MIIRAPISFTLYIFAIADTLKEEEDFKPNALDTFSTEPKKRELFTNAQGLLVLAALLGGGALLTKHAVGSLTDDIFPP